MRIGFVLLNLGELGGAEKRFINIAKGLAPEHDIFILANPSIIELANIQFNDLSKIRVTSILSNVPAPSSNSERGLKSKAVKSKLKISDILKRFLPVKIKMFLKELLFILKYSYSTWKWANLNKIQVINAIHFGGIISVFLRLIGKKIIFSYYDYEVKNGYPFKYISNLGLKTVFKFANKIDLLSPMIYNVLKERGMILSPSKVFVPSSSFIDLEKVRYSEKKGNIITFSGRMEEIKNPMLALQAMKILHDKGINFTFYLLGKGSLNNKIRNYIIKNDLQDKVIFYYEPQVEKILALSSIYLSLQKGNNYPSQALIEAMASGCVIIATDIGETRRLVTEETGILVDFDPIEIAEAVIEVINSTELKKKLSENARSYVHKNFSFEKYKDYLSELYKFN